MKKLLLVMCLLFCSTSYAATYYLSSTGNDNTGDGSSSTPWLTFNKAFAIMSGGDTLIVKDGTYSGQDNKWEAGRLPPAGTSGAWTIVKAEHDGEAVIDGSGTRNMFEHNAGSSTDKYWQFEGIVWRNSVSMNVSLMYCNYVKFLRCGAYDVGAGNTVNFNIGTGNSYILLENCYAYGSGRYKFLIGGAQYIVLRSCVARFDSCDTGVGHGEPISFYATYSTTDCEVQNCIAIDGDQPNTWLYVTEYGGGFYVPSTSQDALRINFTNCITLNSHLGALATTGNSGQKSEDVNFSNCVFWDFSSPVLNSFNSSIRLRGLDSWLLNCTFGIEHDLITDFIWSYDGIEYDNNSIVRNCIIHDIGLGGSYPYIFYDVETEDYNSLSSITGGGETLYRETSVGAHTKTNINPIYNASTNPTGSLKYITRIEDGSDLDGAGESGSDIGANIKTLIGTSGTLYGETGYNTDTGVSMWPFPNETLIRTKMKAYSGGGVSGDRGFCADGETLTHYIMNYLGNGNPYATGSGVHTPLSGRVSITGRQSVN